VEYNLKFIIEKTPVEYNLKFIIEKTPVEYNMKFIIEDLDLVPSTVGRVI
jgi:hypothetical protein